jgi:hypothetical protein
MLETEFAVCWRMLRDLAGEPVQIVETERIGGGWAPVERFCFDTSYPDIGKSVIVKTRRSNVSGWGGSPANLLTEQRALSHLQDVGLRVAPEPLAFNDHMGVLVMTDLAPGQPVEHALFGTDYDDAKTALVGQATTTGSVHAATTGIPEGVWNASSLFGHGLERHWKTLARASTDLGFPDPSLAVPDVQLLMDSLGDERWRAFTHGDLTPGNAIQCLDGVRLVDFEGAGPRHACLDAANFRLSFPAYGYWAAISGEVLMAVDGAYRAALVEGMPRAEDDVEYGHAMATGCAAWTVLRLDRLILISSEDQAPHDMLRRRSQIVHTVDSCISTMEPTRSFLRLAEWLRAVAGEMRQRWPEANADPRQFPAFADGPS